MVLKVKPFVIKCKECGWNKVISPKSDVLMADDFFEICPVCESKEIFREDIGIFNFSRFFKDVW